MIENAKWIWADCAYSINQYVDFFLDFNIDCVDKNAVLEISVDSEYAVWLNGSFAGCGQYHDYPDKKSYDTLDVGDMLKEGENRLEICAYHQGGKSMQYARGINALCFALNNFDNVYISDENVMAAVNTNYASGDTYMITAQLGYGFMYDANSTNGDFSPAAVKAVDTVLAPRPVKKNVIGDIIPAKIIAQGYFIRGERESDNIAHRMYTDFLSHRKFEDIFAGEPCLPGGASLFNMQYDGVYVIIDLGREESGYFTMDMCVDKGTLIEIGYGEHLDDMRVRTEIKTRRFANSYIAKGGGESFTYYFKRIAGRYLQLHISGTESLEINYIGLKPCFYPVNKKASFRCSDSLHNKIYEVCMNTLRHCMHEHYEDCPWREQALYASDSRNQILCGYYTYEDYDFIRASLALLGDSFGEDGYQTICAPTDELLRIPSFTLLWFLEITEYYEFTGDSYFVDNYWDKLEAAVAAYEKNGFEPPAGDNYWNFYEWSEGYENVGKNSLRLENPDFFDGIYKVFVYIALKSMVSLADSFGKKEFYEKYTTILNKLKNEINQKLWDAEKGMYCSYYYAGKGQHYGELMQVMAVYSGVAAGKEDALCSLIANPGNGLVKITLSYSLYKYEVLLGRGGRFDRLVFDEIAEKWGRMLFKGATSFWETEGGAEDFQLAGSLCHGWSAFPVYLYYRYVMGITPAMLRGSEEPGRWIDVFASFEGHCADIQVIKKEGEQCDYIK
ncbi:MAG: family 78 glycoside hydrolase catalytic domain [Clostridia bacterium]|nr:family 78 glycoside hydrolase catalytic domain [Clostridia bacterium]